MSEPTPLLHLDRSLLLWPPYSAGPDGELVPLPLQGFLTRGSSTSAGGC